MPARGSGRRSSVVRGRPVHRDRDAVDRRRLAARRRPRPGPRPPASFQPPCVIGPSASRHSTSGEAARVERRAGQEGVARQRRDCRAAAAISRRGEGDQRSVGGAPVDRARRVVLGIGVVVAALAEAELRCPSTASACRARRAAASSRLRSSRARAATIAGSSLGPSTPWFQERLSSVPSRLCSPLASLCLCVVGDEIGEGEAVVGDDEIDALRRRRGVRRTHRASPRSGSRSRRACRRRRARSGARRRGSGRSIRRTRCRNWPSW